MPWSGSGSWIRGHTGDGSADWWVTWVTGHKMWPTVSSAVQHSTQDCETETSAAPNHQRVPLIRSDFGLYKQIFRLFYSNVCFTFNANQTRSSAAAQIARVTAAGRRQKLDFFDYIFVADIHSVGITLMNLTQVAPIAAGSCEITRNDGHWADQGHSRLRILVPIESPYATFFYTLSRTVSK